MPENFLAYGLIEKYSGIFISGMGGISPEGIRLALDVEYIPEDLKSEIIQKISVYINTAIKTQKGN